MKRVYLYLKDGSYTCYADIPDEVPLPPLATTVPIPKDMNDPVWGNNQWQERPKNTSDVKYSDVLKPLPTVTQKLVMQQSQFALQQAQFQVNQQKLNSRLALQLAQITAKEAQNV
ncbi:hypothetical protein [Limosilactobacillus reuteri]|uniref:hypothetical protein n=1 Tax=Limosilactobacillus reuteri TaxID=1598 RepID=UPI00143DA926|nr:hypothetical protein [Limosilactobacillus reuteri]QIZ03445.1 hypothetical protein GXL24_06325 [Limosilactobacillus reuteri]